MFSLVKISLYLIALSICAIGIQRFSSRNLESGLQSIFADFYELLLPSSTQAHGFERKTILITGVSGLIGRLVFYHLLDNYSNKYYVIGVDINQNMSFRYKIEDYELGNDHKLLVIPSDRFFVCNITHRDQLHEITRSQKVKIIIHLAAVSEYHPDPNFILFNNVEGSKNVFTAPEVERIIFTSSIMPFMAYLEVEPYLSIIEGKVNNISVIKQVPRITVDGYPPKYGRPYMNSDAYSLSKIICEQMAKNIVETNRGKSIISIRLGSVSAHDEPPAGPFRHTWISHRDMLAFFDKTLEAPKDLSGIYFAVSNNSFLWVDLDSSIRDLNYSPKDGVEYALSV